MQKRALYFSLLVLTLASCSGDELAPQQPVEAPAPLLVEAVVGSGTRTSLIDNTSFDTFTLYGFDNSNQRFANAVDFAKSAGQWAPSATSPALVWPIGDNPCNFFAVSPFASVGNVQIEAGSTTRSFHYACLADGNTQQNDVLVASKLGIKKSDNDGKVQLAFNHALAFARFKAKSELTGFTIKVKSITICNLVKEGTFTFSTTDESTGAWTLGTVRANYTITPTAPVTLTATDQYIEDKDGTLMTIPQTTASRAWNPAVAMNTTTDSYLKVNCQIYTSGYNYVGNPTNNTFADVYIPFSGELKQKTVYTFRLNMLNAYSLDTDLTGIKIFTGVDVEPVITASAAPWSTIEEMLTL